MRQIVNWLQLIDYKRTKLNKESFTCNENVEHSLDVLKLALDTNAIIFILHPTKLHQNSYEKCARIWKMSIVCDFEFIMLFCDTVSSLDFRNYHFTSSPLVYFTEERYGKIFRIIFQTWKTTVLSSSKQNFFRSQNKYDEYIGWRGKERVRFKNSVWNINWKVLKKG